MKSLVLSASNGYQPGVIAFLNSFEHHHPDTDIKVYLLNLNIGDPFLDEHVRHRKYVEVVSLDWVEYAGNRNTAWSTKIPRFKFASELSGQVLVCDADMFFCKNIDMFFDVAKAGFIVGGANGSNFYFGKDYAEKWGEPVDCFWTKTLGSVPTWMDVDKYRHIWQGIYDCKLNKKNFGIGLCDFELLNILLIKNVHPDKIIVLPSQQVTGLHHFQLRPDTRVYKRRDQLVTADGLEVLMVHGKWWQEGWVNNMMKTMEKYCAGNEKCIKGAKDSWNLLKSEFGKWENKKGDEK